MEGIFLKLLNMSIQASLLIVIIILLRLILKKSPKWIHCLMWMLVAIRLICPFSIESVFSLAPDIKVISMPISEGRLNIQAEATLISRLTDLFSKSNYSEGLSGQKIAYKEGVGLINFASYAWIAGILALMLYAFVSYLIILRHVRESICIKENIFICDRIKTPFILGIVRPYIYLPSNINDEQRSSIIAHEQAHLKRGDYIWKPLGYCLLAIYWFNPLCWLAYILLCRDIEIACDEKVIKDMDIEQRRIYSKTLLSFSESERLISVYPPAFGEVGVRQRIKSVLNYKRPAFWITIASIAIIIVTSILFLTNPPNEEMVSFEQIAEEIGATTSDENISSKQMIFDTIDAEQKYDTIPRNLRYEFDGCTVEPRWYTFDGYTLHFCYDVIGDDSISQDISVKLMDQDIETVYYFSNKSDERTIMTAIIFYNEYRSSTDISITYEGDSNGTAYVFHIERNEEIGRYSAFMKDEQ